MANVKDNDMQIPAALWFRLIAATLWPRSRSFSSDAALAVSGILSRTNIVGLDNIPGHGPCLVTCNHYTRSGLEAWWGPLLISVAVASQRHPSSEREIHWVMTAAWTFPDNPWRRKFLTPLTRWAFQRVAKVYGFVTMPPMPPAPDEVYARAEAVRKTLRLARRLAPNGGMIGLAPEGRDTTDVVGSAPDGAGEFIYHICKNGLPVLPVGVSESQNRLQVIFGQTFVPEAPAVKVDRDRAVAQQVMDTIRHLTAFHMR